MDTRQILEEFPAYLEANRLAWPQHIPHLRRWAQRYLDAPADPALAPDDRLRTFLAALAQGPGVTDWQVRQAEVERISRYRGGPRAPSQDTAGDRGGGSKIAALIGTMGVSGPAGLRLARWRAGLRGRRGAAGAAPSKRLTPSA